MSSVRQAAQQVFPEFSDGSADSRLEAPGLLEEFRRVRGATERLISDLSAEDCVLQSMPDASPTKWHLAHTTWFFETFVLSETGRSYSPFEESFAYLFNSYYNSVGPMHPRPERGMLSRPTLGRVLEYRSHVDQAVGTLLAEHCDSLSDQVRAQTLERIELGLHHEQQHQELILTDIKHAFSRSTLEPAYCPGAVHFEDVPARHRWVRFSEGLVEAGHDGTGFAFDNESPRHRSFTAEFELASRPVTNGEFLEFILDGGYERHELWLSEGWIEANREGWEAPKYWRRRNRDDDWKYFTLHGPMRLEPEAPVTHVSYFEADAYARWKGARLPSEIEWERAAAEAAVEGNFVESGALRPRAAGTQSDARVAQLFGDVWEWTASAYSAYPGYRPSSGALGEYNGKFMSGQMVLRGGSCVTPQSHMRATYRNFFPANTRWQMSGIRLARDTDAPR